MNESDTQRRSSQGVDKGRALIPVPWSSPARLGTFMILGVLVFLNFIYIYNTTCSIGYQDFVALRGFIEASAQRQHSFSDFFTVGNGVYKNPALFWVLDMDVRYVGFDQRYELYFYLIFKLITAIVLVLAIWRAHPSAGLMALLPTLPLFSIGQWENLVLSVGGYFFAVVCLIITYQQIGAVKARTVCGLWFWYIGLTLVWGVSFLFFTASYTVPAALALISLGIINLICRRCVSITPVLLAVVGLVIYMYCPRIYAGAGGLRLDHWDQIVAVCHFFVVNVGACYMHSEQRLSLVLVTWIGVGALIVNLGLAYYLVRKNDRLSQFCLFLLLFSLFTSGIISLGRFHFGPGYAVASRYTTITCLSQVALLVVAIRLISGVGAKRVVAIAAILVVSMALYFANRRELAIQPARRAFYHDLENGVRARCRDAAFKRAFQADNAKDVGEYLDIVERNHLSVFNKK